ncbi:TetR/AcrR family transcriptional regulator [Streptomyces sp. NBC_01789]|uniref:TetR/AcrR family transcriptional regulator n=1 Tax=unclassified Streptomyces TaxID=2593676 RepID=UPI00225AF7E3|nr:TetR/AcrR family transcriptional regulator [Streptomyces sp. NBC_01789]MCX4451353.1 TetR/AcrR family transcriptional regulator [Streptomyces sp. NBC_01789]
MILRAAADVIGQVGPVGLTLAAVAREVGLVPGTLMQRFGSKRGLLLALAEHSAKNAAALPERVREEHESALEALAALIVEPMASMATPETFANHLAFLCIDLTDPQFRQHALAIHQAQSRAIEALLTESLLQGELRAGTDIAALASSVQAITSGAGLLWALDRQGTLVQRLRQELNNVLSPHFPPRHGNDLEEL